MRETASPTRYLSVADVCDRLGVTDRTVRGWIADGVLPASRIGKRLIRIHEDDLDGIIRAIPTVGDRA